MWNVVILDTIVILEQSHISQQVITFTTKESMTMLGIIYIERKVKQGDIFPKLNVTKGIIQPACGIPRPFQQCPTPQSIYNLEFIAACTEWVRIQEQGLL